MSIVVLENAKVWLGGYDLSGQLNAVSIGLEADKIDATTFGCNGWQSHVAGLKSLNAGVVGFWDVNYDGVLLNNLTTSSAPFSTALLGVTAGNQAYCFNARSGTYNPADASVGELIKFDASISSASDKMARGLLLAAQAITGDGSGTAFQLGAVASTKKLCAALHITAWNATSLVVTLSSSATEGGAYTTQATFATATSVGGKWLTPISGPITDTWWKANWDITGTSATIAVIAGIE